MCNEFLFPEIAWQESCQEELGLISDKMRDTNPRTLFSWAVSPGGSVSVSGIAKRPGCNPDRLENKNKGNDSIWSGRAVVWALLLWLGLELN